MTVSNFLTNDIVSREHISHWTTSMFGSSNSSTFPLNMSTASLSISKPTHNLEQEIRYDYTANKSLKKSGMASEFQTEGQREVVIFTLHRAPQLLY